MPHEPRPPKTYWSITEGVFNCLIDEDRTEAFGNAIRNAVRKGDVVVDMGSGSGILALIAAKAGASRVYAVEFDEDNVKTLKEVVRRNGLEEIVHIIHGDVTTVDLPEQVDVIVGEMIATGLIEELQVQASNNILRFAKPDTRVVLEKFESSIDLVWNNASFYDMHFDVVRYEYAGEESLASTPHSNSFPYSLVDFSKQVTDRNVAVQVQIPITKKGTINGLRISSRTIFSDTSTFGFSFAYSYPIILPIPQREVAVGEELSVELSYELCGGFNTLRYSVA